MLISRRVFIFSFFILLPIPFWFNFDSIGVNLIDIGCIIIGIGLLIDLPHIEKLFNIKYIKYFIIYCLLYFIYLLNGDGISTGPLIFIIRYGIEPIIVFLGVLRYLRSNIDVKIMVNILAFSSIISAFVAIYQLSIVLNVAKWNQMFNYFIDLGIYPQFNFMYFKNDDIFYRRPGGFFSYGGEFGCFMPVVFFLVIRSLNKTNSLGYRYFIKGVLTVLFIGIIASSTRGMVFGFLISFTYYSFNRYDNKKYGAFLLLSILTFSITTFLPEELLDRYLLKSRSETMDARIGLSQVALAESIEFPRIIIGKTSENKTPSHNKFIDELQTKGVVGVIVYIMMFYNLFHFSKRERSNVYLPPLVIFWALVSLTTAAPFGTYHTLLLFPTVLAISYIDNIGKNEINNSQYIEKTV